MQFSSSILAVAVFAMGALAHFNYTDTNNEQYVTATTTSYSTYCPESTNSYPQQTKTTAYAQGTAAGTGVGPANSVRPFIGAAGTEKIPSVLVVVALGAVGAFL